MFKWEKQASQLFHSKVEQSQRPNTKLFSKIPEVAVEWLSDFMILLSHLVLIHFPAN